ncbi:MAG: efflux transporter outer membrane subunit [Thermodesulfobacteriota bacterium]
MALATLAGCGVHGLRLADITRGMPDVFSEGEDATPAGEAGRWWERFEDPGLNALMEEAFANNLDLIVAEQRLAQTEAVARATGAAEWPQVEAGATGGRQSFGVSAGSSSLSAAGFNTGDFRLSATASYELDLWKKIASRARAARADALASREDIKALYISISAQLADLYYLAIEQKAQLELADRTIAAFEETLARVESRYRAGLVPALDLYQSRQNLATAKAARPAFESNLDRTRHAISVLLGRFPGAELAAQGSVLPEPPEFHVGLPSSLLRRRPDIEAARLRVDASDYRVAEAMADRFPSFNLIGEYGGASDTLGTILESPNIFWNVFIQAAMPVIDGGRRKAEVERTDAAYNEALARYRKALLTSFQEVEDALSSASASKERIKMLEERVRASESSLRLALDSYMAGLSDYLPVLAAQQGYYDASSALLAARRQLISDRIALARSLGGQWADRAAEKMTIGRTGRKDFMR